MAEQVAAPDKTAAGRYALLEIARQPFLERARQCAALTIPGLMPPQGMTGASKLPQPYQSIGADGVNNLSAKLLLALFPPGSGFFRLTMDDFLVEKMAEKAKSQGQNPDDARAAFEEALGKVERAVANRMEQKGNRKDNFEGIQHAIVCGNGLLFVQPDGGEKFIPMDRYVVKRDLDGNVLEIIVKESMSTMALPKVVQDHLTGKPSVSDIENDNEKNVDLFTWIQRTPRGSWTVAQWADGSIINGTKGTYPKDKSPWIPLRWRAIPGEDYGRGRVEEYLGDMISAETSQQAIVEFGVQASKVLWFVNGSGTTDKKKVAEAPNGAVLEGEAKDVTVLMMEKTQDFGVMKAVFDDTKKRLERAFLNSSAVQRDAERVTAEEIRAMISELETGLGGVYAILAEEFQRPLAARVLLQMTKSGDLPELPEKVVSPQIVTGMEGLGRQTDLQRLDAFVEGLSTHFGPEAVAEAVNVGAYAKRRGAALGLDIKGLIRTDEEIQQSRQATQQQETAQKLGPAAIKAMSDQKAAQPSQPQA